MKNTQMNFSMIHTPARMNMPRKTSEMMMPTMSTSCWYLGGTLKAANTMMNTKTLSIDSEYSMSHPARNSPLACLLPKRKSTPAKIRARAT